MIPSSPVAKFGAAVLALIAVGALVGAQLAAEEIRVEGGGEPVEASLGDSFANLAGAVAPAETPQPLTPVTPAEPPVETTPVETPPLAAMPEAIPLTPTNAAPEERAPVEPAPPEEASETITAAEPPAVDRAPRPPERPERRQAEARAPEPDPEQPRRETTSQASRAGSETGSRDAPAARSGPRTQRAAEAGNAAASNYPGEVMQRISRQRKPSVRSRGTATVSFQVAASGGLAAVGLAGSSGSAELDREAVRLIQRAAPFPPPPAGARRDFSIQISGR